MTAVKNCSIKPLSRRKRHKVSFPRAQQMKRVGFELRQCQSDGRNFKVNFQSRRTFVPLNTQPRHTNRQKGRENSRKKLFLLGHILDKL